MTPRRLIAPAALLLAVSLAACAAPAGTPSAAATPSSAASGAGAAVLPSPSPVGPTADIAGIDAAIVAADPHNLVQPVLPCINEAASRNAATWNLYPPPNRTFYELVVSAAKQCGVNVVLQVGPQTKPTFIPPTS